MAYIANLPQRDIGRGANRIAGIVPLLDVYRGEFTGVERFDVGKDLRLIIDHHIVLRRNPGEDFSQVLLFVEVDLHVVVDRCRQTALRDLVGLCEVAEAGRS